MYLSEIFEEGLKFSQRRSLRFPWTKGKIHTQTHSERQALSVLKSKDGLRISWRCVK